MFKDIIITLLYKEHFAEAADILREAFPWCYGDTNADDEIKNMLDPERVAFVAVLDNHVVGLVGAIPQYGVTG